MDNLTVPQQKTLDFLREEARAGRPMPTHREIAAYFGYKSHHAAACIIRALKKKGVLEYQKGKARSLSLGNLETDGIPIFGSIPAGFGQDREQNADGCVSVNIEAIGFKPSKFTFALRVSGDSMIGRHICDGDIVIMEHGPEPRNGDIVAALIDGTSTLKTFLVMGRKAFLRAENPKYPTLIPSEELMIQGIFRALIRRAKA